MVYIIIFRYLYIKQIINQGPKGEQLLQNECSLEAGTAPVINNCSIPPVVKTFAPN